MQPLGKPKIFVLEANEKGLGGEIAVEKSFFLGRAAT